MQVEFNKLVRDLIPSVIEKQGKIPVIKRLNNDDFDRELDKKLLEEINEYLESGSTEELVDIYQLILSILARRNIPLEQFEYLRQEKARTNGEFVDGLYLIKVIE